MLVVGDQGLGLLVINGKTVPDCEGLVVVALHERRAVEVADTGAGGRAIVKVILVSVLYADASASEACNQTVVGDVDQDRPGTRPM